jgi:hypothetical protein
MRGQICKPIDSVAADRGAVSAADRAIAACGEEARDAVKALLVDVDFLEAGPTNCGRRCRAAATINRATATSDCTDVTYYVALPFVLADDALAAGEASSASAPTPLAKTRLRQRIVQPHRGSGHWRLRCGSSVTCRTI